jgi:hypothetical protein
MDATDAAIVLFIPLWRTSRSETFRPLTCLAVIGGWFPVGSLKVNCNRKVEREKRERERKKRENREESL